MNAVVQYPRAYLDTHMSEKTSADSSGGFTVERRPASLYFSFPRGERNRALAGRKPYPLVKCWIVHCTIGCFLFQSSGADVSGFALKYSAAAPLCSARHRCDGRLGIQKLVQALYAERV
jgi:hypothetical protein